MMPPDAHAASWCPTHASHGSDDEDAESFEEYIARPRDPRATNAPPRRLSVDPPGAISASYHSEASHGSGWCSPDDDDDDDESYEEYLGRIYEDEIVDDVGNILDNKRSSSAVNPERRVVRERRQATQVKAVTFICDLCRLCIMGCLKLVMFLVVQPIYLLVIRHIFR